MKKISILVGCLVVALGGVGYFLFNSIESEQPSNYAGEIDSLGLNAQVFKSATCGCCKGYVSFLEDEQFQTKKTDLELSELDELKENYGIPTQLRSCHTTIIGDYFIEGHVPLEAVNKLLTTKPDIDGIALPGMPAGTPGMAGKKTKPYVIYQVKNGKYKEFMVI